MAQRAKPQPNNPQQPRQNPRLQSRPMTARAVKSRSLSRPITLMRVPVLGQPAPAYLARRDQQSQRRNSKRRFWMMLALVATPLVLVAMVCAFATLGFGMVYASGDVLPGVSSGGVALGGQSVQEAANTLRQQWNALVVEGAGTAARSVNATQLGITLDADATARNAANFGRGSGNAGFGGALRATLGSVDVPPVLNVDLAAAREALYGFAPEFEIAPVNAGVRFVSGQVQPTEPHNGLAVDVEATLAQLQRNAGEALADGTLELVTVAVAPEINDATPMVAMATQLLSSPLRIYAYDPVSDNSDVWTISPETWAAWISATPDSSRPEGIALTLDPQPVEAYLQTQESSLGGGRYIDTAAAALEVQQAVSENRTNPFVRVYHDDRQHTVQAGETIVTIAWDYGVPYPWIQNSNPGVGDALSPGQTITVPTPDEFLPYPVIYNKRIVVSISAQRLWAYEDGQVKWDWPASTGITSSPTWPGIYQIQSHEVNAYAGNWDLWMPHFMGVYQPIPGSDFTNGFHGFPTRGGAQLLWTNSLGTRVTYGCILVSSDNAEALYNWAQEGVVVEIQA
ncbi:MAG: L,D-transpeptidase family protein [Burkholderiales bacterium]|nr:L,D-transpeptidase family protein [Anaerolineae bacterium]